MRFVELDYASEGMCLEYTQENLFHVCIKHGHVQALELLLQTFKCHKGLKAKDYNGNTPTHSFALNIFSDYDDLERILNLLSPDKPASGTGNGSRAPIRHDDYLDSNKKRLLHVSTPNNKG